MQEHDVKNIDKHTHTIYMHGMRCILIHLETSNARLIIRMIGLHERYRIDGVFVHIEYIYREYPSGLDEILCVGCIEHIDYDESKEIDEHKGI